MNLIFENVNYQYPKGKTLALKDINLATGGDRVIALMGRTGSGKTTLLSAMNGIIPQFHDGNFDGKVLLNEDSTSDLPIQQLVRKVGLVLQDPETQIFGLTVEKDIAFGPSNLNFPKEKINEIVKMSARAVNLESFMERSPDQLSGGEKQRLAIAGILALESPVLVLDEPTSELDPEGAETVNQALQNLKNGGHRLIIFSTHNPDNVIGSADEIWVMESGEIKYIGDPGNFFSHMDLPGIYGLQIPEVTDLFRKMHYLNWYKKDELPVTLESAVSDFEKILKKVKNINVPRAKYLMTRSAGSQNRIIEIDRLSHHYTSGQLAVDNVSLTINSQQIVAILGKNGAGKTTLVKHLIGLLRPTQGRVLIKGRDIADLRIEEISRDVGFVFQNPDHQIFSPSIYEEIEYGLLNHGFDKVSAKEKIQNALELTGLTGKEHLHPFSLSKGERQKIAMASVLAVEPEIIVIDEPTTGLDWRDSIALMEEIRKLKEKGHTIIMITHNLRLAADYADKVILLQNGKLICEGETHSILNDMELLKKTSLRPLQISLLVHRMKKYGIPQDIITISELIDYMKFVIQEN
ncbi:MAG: ABC transporter ATP-binding protein [Calditrichaceae bacterium]